MLHRSIPCSRGTRSTPQVAYEGETLAWPPSSPWGHLTAARGAAEFLPRDAAEKGRARDRHPRHSSPPKHREPCSLPGFPPPHHLILPHPSISISNK